VRFSCCFLVLSALGLSQDSADLSLREKQQAQEKARAVAAQLVDHVLSMQLRQLEENGLRSIPVYRDVAAMREDLGRLMRDEMERIVQLLIDAQHGPQPGRVEKVNAARALTREVVVRLMADRQKLLRRMHLSKLSAEVRQLIALQTKTYETTQALAAQTQNERERLTLATIEDLADVNKI
jgi:hypothetical protein